MIDSIKKSNKQQPKKHKYQELLTHLQCCTKAPLSYKEQAEIVGCSKFFAKKIAKQNLINQIISITPTTHKSFGRNLKGKNIYGHGKNFDPKIHLLDDIKVEMYNLKFSLNINYQTLSNHKKLSPNDIDKASKSEKQKIIRRFVQKNSHNPKKFTTNKNSKENLDKSKFAKASGTPSAGYFYSSYEEFLEKSGRKALFAKYGFEDQVEKAPNWWFRDIKKLESALKLVKSKLSNKHKPFKLKNFNNFMSYLLKHGVFGWHRHCARELSIAIVQPSIKNTLKFCMSDPIEKTYLGLKELHEKNNLKLGFACVQKLLRSKFPKLSAAVSVCLTRLSWKKGDQIRDINAFLNYLIGMHNPFDYLKTKNEAI